MNKEINIKKISFLLIIVYLVLGISFYFIGGEQLHIGRSDDSLSYNMAQTPIGEITNDTIVEQDFSVKADIIEQISVKVATYGRSNTGNLFIKLIDKDNGEVLFNQTVDVSSLKDGSNFSITPKDRIKGVMNKKLSLVITSDTKNKDNAVTLWSAKSDANSPLYINGQLSENTLTFAVECDKVLLFGEYYWRIFTTVLALLLLFLWNLQIKQRKGEQSLGLRVISAFIKYNFLLSQLIERDFKTKYKRSILGILWSFLNPLLTMLVQYIVFSTIFKSDIANFPVYLLSGIVVFNFFTEACGMGLMSIVGNASLITKVYMPKYIYPVSKVLSSVINLCLSLIPLIIVMLLTNVHITHSMFLVPFGLICVIVFCIGMAFILSSAMVFFRDTQFLWSVLSLLWMYATPVFYPENIIPDKFSFVLKLNPLYHFIRFIRTCILNGVSPEPIAYLYCIVFSFGILVIGAIIFKKTQDKFVLNI
ncbi:ABC transporter permease [Clostridium sp.]|uniref:ABC transporter permease n=1 Tax=Clostridium sp. TaxID=1506 RepID=UPI00261B4D5F|nr:ABC transporter permease [Clostridium sp.]